MADNLVLNSGAGGATLSTDEVSRSAVTQHVQYVKLMNGTDAAIDVIPGEASNGLDVDVTRVQGTVAVTQSGTWTVQPGNTANTTAWLTTGTGGTFPVTDSGGSLTVDNGGTFAVQAAQSGTWNVTNVSGTVSLPTGASTSAKQPTLGTAGAASTDVLTIQGIASMTALQIADNGGSLTVDGTVTANLAAGTNNIGDVDVLTVPADPFGVNADAASATGSISAKLRFIAATGIPVTSLPNVTLAAGTNTNEVVGDVAHDAPIAGNPVRLAGRALTADYTAVAAGDTADLITTLLGKLVTIPYANPNNTWSSAAASGGIVNTTGTTAKAAAGVGVRNYITHASVINGHATVDTDVQIRDGASGTVLWRGFAKAAGGGVSESFDPPLRGTANTLVEVANGTTGSATYFNLQGFSAAE